MTEQAVDIHFTLNGAPQSLSVAPNRVLFDLLRDSFGLTGAKLGCDQAVCGACTVLIDGRPASSCATFAFQADGADIVTIEGLKTENGLDAVQTAFADHGALQCGYCTPGMVLLARALLDRDPAPDRDAIRNWMGANICRCTGYEMIFEAVERAASLRSGR